jgi:acyl carrier protein
VDNQKLEKKIREVLSVILDIDIGEVTKELHLDNTPNWNSLNHLRITVELENEFSIQLEPAVIAEIIDYPSIVETVIKLTQK